MFSFILKKIVKLIICYLKNSKVEENRLKLFSDLIIWRVFKIISILMNLRNIVT